MGITLVIGGLFFLFNPNFNIIDFIPDFIGLFLIFIGLTSMAHISEDIKHARKMAIYLAALDLLKFLSIGIAAGNDEKTWKLLLAFSFGVCQCILFYNFIQSFFSGIERLGTRYDSSSVFNTYEVSVIARAENTSSRKLTVNKQRRDVITRAKNTAIAFYFARTALATIPEFAMLPENDLYFNYEALRSLLYIFGAAIAFVWSLVYLARIWEFLLNIKNDAPFISALKNAHKEFESSNPSYKISTRMIVAMSLYALAIVSMFNLNEDGLPFIPLIVPAVILTIAAILLSVDNKRILICLAVSIPASIVSVVNTMSKADLYKGFTKFKDIFHFEKIADRFYPISNLTLLEYILLIALFVTFTYFIFKEIKEHLNVWDRDAFGMTAERAEAIRRENIETVGFAVRIQRILMSAVLLINTVNVKLAVFLGAMSADVRLGDADYPGMVYHILIILNIVLTLIWFVHTLKLTRFVKKEIYTVDYSLKNHELSER